MTAMMFAASARMVGHEGEDDHDDDNDDDR